MFETLQIIVFGTQPTAKVSQATLERIIHREFGNHANEIRQKLESIKSDTSGGKARILAAILKLSNKDLNAVDYFVGVANSDFRDVILQAEYPRVFNSDFHNIQKDKRKKMYLADWKDYSKWLTQV